MSEEDAEVLDVEVEEREKAAFDQALASLDGRTQQVLSNLMMPPVGAGPGEGASVGIVEVTGRMVPGAREEGAGREMRLALIRARITADSLAGRLAEGLKASKTVLVAGRLRRVPDFAVRLKYLELAHKLRGDVQAASAELAGPTSSYEERILAVAGRLAGRLSGA